MFILQILIAEALFAVRLERRKYFALRLSLSLIVYVCLCLIIPPLLFSLRDYLFYMVIWLLSLLIFPVCFRNKIFDMLFCAVAALLVQNLANNLGVLACDLLGIDPDVERNIRSGFLQVPVYVAVHIVCYFLYARKITERADFSSEKWLTIILLITSAAIIFLLYNELLVDGLEYYWVVYVLFAFYDVLALGILFGSQILKSLKSENKELEDLLHRESKLIEYNRHAIDIINLKSHDLKHYLSVAKAGEVENEEHLSEIREAIAQYESVVKTENSILNIILTEKAILCGQYKIKFSHLVDEQGLKSIKKIDLAALLNNILDNAIEHLLTVEKDKRFMSLNIMSRNGFCAIHCENYCASHLQMTDGLPVTTKANKEFHGFGLKSVRDIVKKYDGYMTLEVKGELFLLDIMIPIDTETNQQQ